MSCILVDRAPTIVAASVNIAHTRRTITHYGSIAVRTQFLLALLGVQELLAIFRLGRGHSCLTHLIALLGAVVVFGVPVAICHTYSLPRQSVPPKVFSKACQADDLLAALISRSHSRILYKIQNKII